MRYYETLCMRFHSKQLFNTVHKLQLDTVKKVSQQLLKLLSAPAPVLVTGSRKFLRAPFTAIDARAKWLSSSSLTAGLASQSHLWKLKFWQSTITGMFNFDKSFQTGGLTAESFLLYPTRSKPKQIKYLPKSCTVKGKHTADYILP